jgi:two-component system OmpR family response regulator
MAKLRPPAMADGVTAALGVATPILGLGHSQPTRAAKRRHIVGAHYRGMTMATTATPDGREHSDGRSARVLVVDDEPALAELLTTALHYEGWEVRSADSGSEALRIAAEFEPDAVLLDLMLPDMDGREVLRHLRRDHPEVPVLFLTARDGTEDRSSGLAAGANGYVTKPFSLEAVVTQVRKLLHQVAEDSPLVVGDLSVNVRRGEVRRGGEPIVLTATEFEVLLQLVHHAGRPVTEQEILEHVWGRALGGRTNIVALCVTYLRKKIDGGRRPMIRVSGEAEYVLAEPDD